MKILCLDIDDSVLPSNNTYFGQVNDNFEIFELNLKRIQMMIQKYDMKVFITSSLYASLSLNATGELSLKNINFMKPEDYSMKTLNVTSKYLNGNVIGLSSGNRFNDIKKILYEGHIVVAIDDTDLSIIKDDNFLFIETRGFITNDLTFKIDSFMKNRVNKGTKEKSKLLNMKKNTTLE